MKKKVFAVLCTVLIVFNSMILPVMAVAPIIIAVGTTAVTWICTHIVNDIDTAIWNDIKTLTIGKYREYKEANKLIILGYWDDVISSSGITETAFRSLITGISTEEFYWMFTDCNCSIDDICDYVFRTSSKSGEAFETVKVFVEDSNFSEDDLRALHDLTYVHRTEVYDFISKTIGFGISIEDICDFCFDDVGAAVDNPITTVNENKQVEITGATFAEICAQLQEQYAPGNADGYLSWKEGDGINSYWQDATCSFLIFRDGTWISSSNTSNGVYCVPYYYDGTKYYYNDVQWYFTGTSVNGSPYIQVTATSLIDGSTTTDNLLEVSIYRYISVDFFNYLICFKNIAEVQNAASSSYGGRTYGVCAYDYYDTNYNILCNDTSILRSILAFTKSAPTDSETRDYGVIWSDEPIEIGFCADIDTTRIDPDATVTLAGDTIYDYTITNTNGDTTTINYYITNNYTIPENADDNTDEDNGNTSTSGDITVGGKVDVSGGIDVGGQVDININVNQNGGSGTGEVSAYEYEEVNLQEALEQIPEMGDGFKSWFSRMFDWLPPEILGLIIGGITLAILLRIAGR